MLRNFFSPFIATVLLGAATLLAAETKPDFSNVPGTVIDHSPASSRAYIGSPSIAILPDGNYVASHDLFGPGTPNNQTLIFLSTDHGQTWHRQTRITRQFWSTLFVHHNTLFILGVDKGMGHIVIRKSLDDGKSWTTPRDSSTGLLFKNAKYHCAPVPVLISDGRICRGFEEGEHPKTMPDFPAFLISAPEDSDLLNAANWNRTDSAIPNKNWLDNHFDGWEEGNAVATLDGPIVDILRVNIPTGGETAAIVRFDDHYKKPAFNPQSDFIHLPGGDVRFTIRFDPQSHLYWSLSNYLPPSQVHGDPGSTRNTLALISSPDLRHWTVKCVLLHHPDHLHHAFQYLDWQFDGPDLIAVSRTAYDDGQGGAHTFHDANFLTFHRFKNFRKLSTADSVPTDNGK
ncbi:MAG TPA: sialidase family protein [Tepidisphaeraceae bacterium]|jgi:hypothetical protein